MSKPEKCGHTAFRVIGDVHTIPGAKGTRFLSITACCTGCGTPLRFLNLPIGLDVAQVTGSTEGFKMWAPCVLDGEAPTPGTGAPAMPIKPSGVSDEQSKTMMDALVKEYAWEGMVFDINQGGVSDGAYTSKVVHTALSLYEAERWVSSHHDGSYSYTVQPRRPVQS